MKRIVKGAVTVFAGALLVGLALFLLAYRAMLKMNVEEMAIGGAIDAGTRFVNHYYYDKDVGRGLSLAFPRDGELTEEEQVAFLKERWREVRSTEKEEYWHKYYNADIWTTVKNLPDDPPENLIVMATRNIDPSSLRTRLTEEDYEKRIRIDERFVPPANLPILKKFAAIIYVRGRMVVGTGPRNDHTYRCIYKIDPKYRAPSSGEGSPFDLTTNIVDGLQVKYLTTDGEVIPAND